MEINKIEISEHDKYCTESLIKKGKIGTGELRRVERAKVTVFRQAGLERPP